MKTPDNSLSPKEAISAGSLFLLNASEIPGFTKTEIHPSILVPRCVGPDDAKPGTIIFYSRTPSTPLNVGDVTFVEYQQTPRPHGQTQYTLGAGQVVSSDMTSYLRVNVMGREGLIGPHLSYIQRGSINTRLDRRHAREIPAPAYESREPAVIAGRIITLFESLRK